MFIEKKKTKYKAKQHHFQSQIKETEEETSNTGGIPTNK